MMLSHLKRRHGVLPLRPGERGSPTDRLIPVSGARPSLPSSIRGIRLSTRGNVLKLKRPRRKLISTRIAKVEMSNIGGPFGI